MKHSKETITGYWWLELISYQKLWLTRTDLLEFVRSIPMSRTQKAVKFIRHVHVSLWLSGSVLIFRAEGSRFEDSSGRWLVHPSFDWTYLVKGLWLCLRELWHSVINTTQHVDNSRKLVRVLWLGHIRISVSMCAGRTADILTKNGDAMLLYFFECFKKIQLSWDSYH